MYFLSILNITFFFDFWQKIDAHPHPFRFWPNLGLPGFWVNLSTFPLSHPTPPPPALVIISGQSLNGWMLNILMKNLNILTIISHFFYIILGHCIPLTIFHHIHTQSVSLPQRVHCMWPWWVGPCWAWVSPPAERTSCVVTWSHAFSCLTHVITQHINRVHLHQEDTILV